MGGTLGKTAASFIEDLAAGRTVSLEEHRVRTGYSTEVICAELFSLALTLRAASPPHSPPAKAAEILDATARMETVSIYDFGDGATEEEAEAIRAVLHESALDLRAGVV